MLWLGIHLPALALEACRATLDADQAARPLALVAEHHVVQADAAALVAGVQPGMKRATAQALLPALLLGQAEPRREAAALQALAHAALAFTPAVALDGPGSALPGLRLEVQSCLRYFGGLESLLARLRTALAPLGHRLQIASAPSARGALLLAHWRDDLALGPHSRDPAALHRLLDAVPLALLGAARPQQALLEGMGLRRIGQLRRLPRDGLARRFGPALLAELDQARGDAPEAHDWVLLPPVFDARLELFARADRSEQLLAGARLLLARLLAWAQARQGRIGRFTLRMHHEPRHRAEADTPALSVLDIALAEPSVDLDHLQLLLAERLGRLPLAAPALELSLHCDALVAAPPPAGELFPTRASAREGLARLVERLQARLGRDQVCRLQPVADHRPERATVLRPVEAAQAAQATQAAQAATAPAVPAGAAAVALPLARPVWLLAEPQPLAEHGGRPWLAGRPLRLLAGPERIESGWWDAALAARDYFVAQAADGALVWLYRARLPGPDEAGGGWFLQGRFG